MVRLIVSLTISLSVIIYQLLRSYRQFFLVFFAQKFSFWSSGLIRLDRNFNHGHDIYFQQQSRHSFGPVSGGRHSFGPVSGGWYSVNYILAHQKGGLVILLRKQFESLTKNCTRIVYVFLKIFFFGTVSDKIMIIPHHGIRWQLRNQCARAE